MKSYKQVFAELNHAAVIPFFVVGDPDYKTSLKIVKSAIDAGADILELGIPFSDPIADGPTIQKADIRSLKSGMTVKKALKFITEIKKYKDIPIGLLMYYNLIFQYGTEKFFRDCHKAGVNSVLVADLSIDDANEIISPGKKSWPRYRLYGYAQHFKRAFETHRLKNHRLHLRRIAIGRNRQPENIIDFG